MRQMGKQGPHGSVLKRNIRLHYVDTSISLRCRVHRFTHFLSFSRRRDERSFFVSFSRYAGKMLNVSNETSADNLHAMEFGNPCPSLRAISRPILFVHNYSLFFFGFLLNILAFAVLMQGSLRCHSTFAYLAFLSLSNGLLSLVRFAQWMCTFYLQTQFENDLWTCRFYRFSLDFLTYFSLFTLVCVNIDRARIVTRNQPRTKYPKSTFRKVALTESLIALVLGAYHSHWLMKFGHQGR